MFLKHLTIAGLMGAAALSASAVAGEAKEKRPVVVELFTSQGCSSCPPADALLGQLAGRRDVLAMTLPVTYWDMLGWRDTLAIDANTQRQKAYAKELGHGGVFTPEIIVDGVADVVGSREQAVDAAVGAREADMQAVRVELAANHQQIRIGIAAAPEHTAREATVWLFGIIPQASVAVRGGENGGHMLAYRNVVRQIRSVATWKGQPLNLTLPRADAGAPRQSIAVVLQQGGYGRVIGAAFIDRPNFSPLP